MRIAAVLLLLLCCGTAQAAPISIRYDPVTRYKWAAIDSISDVSWLDVWRVCYSGICEGSIGGVDVTGWHWASWDQVRTLFENVSGVAFAHDGVLDIDFQIDPSGLSAWAPKLVDTLGTNSSVAPPDGCTARSAQGWTRDRRDFSSGGLAIYIDHEPEYVEEQGPGYFVGLCSGLLPGQSGGAPDVVVESFHHVSSGNRAIGVWLVPEPAGWTLLAGGVLAFARRRVWRSSRTP
jgi:hypothetical protein